MVHITFELIRKKAEHNQGMLDDLQELSLHQLQIEALNKVIGSTCRHLRILYLQNNLIPKLGKIHQQRFISAVSAFNVHCMCACVMYCIENLHRLKELVYLNVALNNITCVENLSSCESLRKLDLTVNFVDVDSLQQSIEHLALCPALEELYVFHAVASEAPGAEMLMLAVRYLCSVADILQAIRAQASAGIETMSSAHYPSLRSWMALTSHAANALAPRSNGPSSYRHVNARHIPMAN